MKRTNTLINRLLSCLLVISVIIITATAARAQSVQKVAGKILSSDNQPIPGVSVKVKGTSTVTITDVQGTFIIPAKKGDVLVLSSVGYLPKEITVADNPAIGSIQLTENSTALNEVVVVAVGYGTSKRSDLTGSIASISAKDIGQTVSATLDQAMQGRMAGVVVNANTGQPGGGVSVQVRGIGTLGSAEPLYVVDGVFFDGGDSNSQIYTGGAPGTNPLATINPSDIESIDVLKDASATAIYGSRGSNGVVIITTKKGKTGAPRINFDGYYGIQQLPKKVGVLDLQQYAAFRNEQARVLFAVPNPLFQDPSVLGPGTNWQSTLFSNAPMQNYNLSIGGGDNRTTFYVSGGYFKQQGIAVKSGFDRYTAKISLDNKTTDWLKIGTNVQLTQTLEQINNQDGSLIQLAIRQSPDISAVNPDGSFGGPATSQFVLGNPYALTLINTNERKRSQFYGSAYADITFLKDFVLRNEVAANYEFGKITQFNPSYTFGALVNTNSFSRRANNTSSNNTFRTYLTYNHTFTKLFRTNATLGHESNLNEYASVDATGSGFTSNISSELSLADQTKATSNSNRAQNALDSYYARFNVTYNERFILTSTFRYDGSSKFAPQNRWNFSYAFGLAYKLTEEAFIKKQNWINDLKLRLGYGILPNQNVGNYVYGASFRGLQTGLGNQLLLNNLPNPDARWENTKSSNLGLDLSILKNRISLTIDAYYKNTDGLLISLSEPLYSGTTPSGSFTVAQLNAPVQNIGSITNKGYEFSLNTQNIRSKNFSWTSTLTYSANRNKVTSLQTDATIIPQYIGTDIVQQVSVGKPIGQFFGYVVEGVYKNAAELNSHARPVNTSTGQPLPIAINSIWVGDLKFKDVNGDGIIDNNDRVDLGSPIPKFQFGINNNFRYKSFDLTVFFNGNYGNKIFNELKQVNEDPSTGFGLLSSVNNYARIGRIDPNGSSTDVNNLVVTNPDTNVPRISATDANQNRRVSSRYIEDGSYIRLKNAVLGYSLPSQFLKRFKLASFRVYTNVANVFTITKYTGYDPEVGSRFQNAQSAGIDFGRYPSQRVYTFGINAGF